MHAQFDTYIHTWIHTYINTYILAYLYIYTPAYPYWGELAVAYAWGVTGGVKGAN